MHDIMSVLRQFLEIVSSGLRIQYLIEAAEVHLLILICSSLMAVVNILAGSRAPARVAMFLTGGSLTALIRNEEGSLLDICLIAVGEINRKCLCIISRVKESGVFFLAPFSLVWLAQQG